MDSSEIGRTYQWHQEFAQFNDAIYPRPENAFQEMVFDRQVWCAMAEDTILALSYAAFDEHENQWEIGGLMVAAEARGKGLGDIMMRLPLINMLVTERPLLSTPAPTIVAHVLKGNDAPRNIIPRAGFVFARPVEIPKDVLPGLRHDDDGMIRGDEFHLSVPNALNQLADWLDQWDQKLKDGSSATIDMIDTLTIEDWSRALRSMAS